MSAMLRQRGALASRLLTDAVRGEHWMDAAACRPEFGVDPELWHDERRLDAAQAVCADCPVTGPCRAFGEQHGDDWGVYGGTTAAARRAARLARTRVRRQGCQFCGNPFWTGRARYCSMACRLQAAHASKSQANRNVNVGPRQTRTDAPSRPETLLRAPTEVETPA